MCPVTSHTMFCYIAGLYVRLTHNELLYEENLKCLQSDNVPPQLQSNLQTTQTSVCTITHTHTLIPMHFKLTCGLHLSVHLWTSLLTFSFVLTVCGFFCWTLVFEVFSSRFVSKQNFCFKLKVINLQLKSIFSVVSLSSLSGKPQIFNFMTNDWNWKIFRLILDVWCG